MSPLRHHDHLDDIAASVRALCVRLLEDERAATEVCDSVEDAQRFAAQAFATRMLRDQALVSYFEESERARARQCPIHGDCAYAMCPECCRIHGMTLPSNVVPLSTSLEQSNDVTKLARELGVEPVAALRIARAALKARRTG